jgi:hypothetical protein
VSHGGWQVAGGPAGSCAQSLYFSTWHGRWLLSQSHQHNVARARSCACSYTSATALPLASCLACTKCFRLTQASQLELQQCALLISHLCNSIVPRSGFALKFMGATDPFAVVSERVRCPTCLAPHSLVPQGPGTRCDWRSTGPAWHGALYELHHDMLCDCSTRRSGLP